ncbi:MAG: Gldg family protein [Acidobacteriota bacterium]|nr:MAG: Gldg family protein [Acidobacteriota bacterium]
MIDLNTNFIKALVRRDLLRYFSSPTGYVFITLFIFLSAAAAFWQDRFFLNNLANLDQLNLVFPLLLIFFVPALTMSVWADERKQATDELLFTMPATSLEVVLGKYISTVGIYTVSLLLSLSHVIVLFWLGSPDLGIMFSNYVGYWFIGSAMIALGMLASLLTSNSAIAFILSAMFCSLLIFIDSILGAVSPTLSDLFAPLTVTSYFQDFSRGVISLSAVLYFTSVAALFIYINVLVVDKRHWPQELEGYPTWTHRAIRIVSVIVALISFNALAGHAQIRLDSTSEQLHSLSDETALLLDELAEERPVFVQAYISPEVPEPYVQTRANLLNVLQEVDAIGGSKVEVLIEETVPFSQQARDAREKFGIVPREIPNLGSARAGFTDVFLGLAFTCGSEEEVIGFLDRGLSAEYELARSIRVVAKTSKKRVGVYETAINLFGGLDFQTMRSTPSWSVVTELRKQYEVVQISKGGAFPEDLDGLLVALPSSLSQMEMDQLKEKILGGLPTLLLVDPLPVVNVGLAPAEQPGANQNPFMRNQAPPPQPKGDIQQFMTDLGVSWDSARIVWDSYNPHPDLAHLPPEVVFVGSGNENPNAFNPEQPITGDLQEIVLLYPGELNKAIDSNFEFTSLLQSGRMSGQFSYFQMVQRSFFGVQLNRNLPHRPGGTEYTMAARVTQGSPAPSPEPAESESEVETTDAEETNEASRLNLIVIADLDFISEQFFQLRARGPENLNFDNVTLFLNAIDTLIGDESFINLRNKRIRHRTLTRVEEKTRDFIQQRVQEEQQAESDAEVALADAQRRLDEKVNEVSQRPDLDARTKQIMARNLQEAENRRFEVLKANIEAEKEAKVDASKENMEEQIRTIQSTIKTFAVLLPPIPVFILGVLIFVKRQRREREGAAAARRLRA